jgi:hypothetical protein
VPMMPALAERADWNAGLTDMSVGLYAVERREARYFRQEELARRLLHIPERNLPGCL